MSLVAILPLLAVYELGLILMRSRVENHAGLLVKRMIGLLGLDAYLVLTAAVALAFVIALAKKHRGPSRNFGLYGLILLESIVYAALLGPAVYLVGVKLSASPDASDVVLRALLYVGAGVWEELVFRLLLLGGFVYVATRGFGGNGAVFAALGVLLSSLAFAAFHHLGPMGEPFVSSRFLFRTLAGMALAALFVFRGLGVCVYTHAFYNVGLLFAGAEDV
ncbi:MAG: CPBP family glutamic-type intramembrane protease [Planctomycetota bacterium]